MAPKVFFKKLASKYLWLNILAMILLFVVLTFGVHFCMNIYTHHGEAIEVPDVRKKSYEASVAILEDLGFEVVVNDTGYVKTLKPGTVLDQLPAPGSICKSGRIIYLSINALSTPTIPLPDIIDNCSKREAIARLEALGFKVAQPQYVAGEKDWVIGVLVNGRSITHGQRVSIEDSVVVQVGNGRRDTDGEVFETDAPERYIREGGGGGSVAQEEEIGALPDDEGAVDNFEIVE